MILLSYQTETHPEQTFFGALLDDAVVDFKTASMWAEKVQGVPRQELGDSLLSFIQAGPPAWQYAHQLLEMAQLENFTEGNLEGYSPAPHSLHDITILSPLPRPVSIRDFYAFEQHVANARAARGKNVPSEWYQFPVFYFSNPNAVFGPGETVPYPAYTQALDYELEIACIIGKAGRDIQPEEAGDYIFGFTIMNDWSARDIQRQEMRVGLGPAKGKDFATSLGPYLITPDELDAWFVNRPGVYDLEMTARVNREPRSQGNWKDIYYSFGEIIARASEEVWLMPGDVLGSGTVGSGSLLEQTRGQGPWLEPGDMIELEIEHLGVLVNRVGAPRS